MSKCGCGRDDCQPMQLTPVGMGEPERIVRPDGSTRLFWKKTSDDGHTITMETTVINKTAVSDSHPTP